MIKAIVIDDDSIATKVIANFCKDHQLKDDVDVKHKKCSFKGCTKLRITIFTDG